MKLPSVMSASLKFSIAAEPRPPGLPGEGDESKRGQDANNNIYTTLSRFFSPGTRMMNVNARKSVGVRRIPVDPHRWVVIGVWTNERY